VATTFFRINAGVSLKSAEIAAPVSLVESLGAAPWCVCQSMRRGWEQVVQTPPAPSAMSVPSVVIHISYLTIRGEGHGFTSLSIRDNSPDTSVAVTLGSSLPARRPDSMT
jgi:hypothetical protein